MFGESMFAFGASPADPCSRQDSDADLVFVQNASISSQFMLEWKLCVVAQYSILEDMAKSKWRRILDRDQAVECADVAIWRFRDSLQAN